MSYYLMPVYATPDLMETLSPELTKRMQGKACFHFKKMDESLLAELQALTAQAIPGFRAVAEELVATRHEGLVPSAIPRGESQRPWGESSCRRPESIRFAAIHHP